MEMLYLFDQLRPKEPYGRKCGQLFVTGLNALPRALGARVHFFPRALQSTATISRPEELPAALEVESEAARAARKKQEAHNDRIVATFNSVS